MCVCASRVPRRIAIERELVKTALLNLCGNDDALRDRITDMYDNAPGDEVHVQGGAV